MNKGKEETMISQETINSCEESLLATVLRLEKWRAKPSPPIISKDFESGDAYNLQSVQEHNNRASRQLLEDCKDALERIQRRTFGKCVACGKEINEDRLIAHPEVRRCVPCQEKRGLRVY